MNKINLKKIIEESGLDKSEVARQLFPINKHPELALNRIISGHANLDADQICKLAVLVDVPIAELFSGGNWKARAIESVHLLTSGEYTAKLNKVTGVTQLYHNESLFHEEIILAGQRVIPEKLLKAGFRFRYEDVNKALENLLK